MFRLLYAICFFSYPHRGNWQLGSDSKMMLFRGGERNCKASVFVCTKGMVAGSFVPGNMTPPLFQLATEAGER